MTRINAGISPSRLCDKHLRSELRELPRALTLIRGRISKGKSLKPTHNFRLGTGHVSFFFDKVPYLFDRYLRLQSEHWWRFGKYWSDPWPVIDTFLDLFERPEMVYWRPSTEDAVKVMKRIEEREEEMDTTKTPKKEAYELQSV